MSSKNDVVVSEQIGELREVAELRRDGASELIRVKEPDRATIDGLL